MIEKEAKANLKELLEHNYLEDVSYLREENDYKTFNIAIETVLKALEQKDQEIAEERIKYLSSNLNNTIKQRQKEDEQLNALNEGWKIELEQKDKELKEYKENALFYCDPDKNKKCKKTSCYINGGECVLTTNIKFRKEREGRK